MSVSSQSVKKVPISQDFFTQPLEPLEKVRLKGRRCIKCGEVFLGKPDDCENCQSANLEAVVLSDKGKLYSYTVVRNRPPGDYKGEDNPFVPFAVGLVALPEGVILLSRLAKCDFNSLKIGMDVKLAVDTLYKDEKGNDVLIYTFKVVQEI